MPRHDPGRLVSARLPSKTFVKLQELEARSGDSRTQAIVGAIDFCFWWVRKNVKEQKQEAVKEDGKEKKRQEA